MWEYRPMPVSEAVSQAISVSNKRLNRTLEYVSKLWIPLNKKTLSTIREGLSNGKYDEDRKALMNELKSDLSLYTWCLRRLCEIADVPEGQENNFDPLRAFEQIEIDQLEELLEVEPHEISQHSLESSNEEQVKLLQEAILGATTAETLAEKQEGDSRAYGATLLRQLGLTLIAWNYPSVFSEVMQKVKKGADLDTEMTMKLGFSPALLATNVVRSWGVSQQKCYSLGLDLERKDPRQPAPPQGQQEKFLWEVCEFGERLARASNPETYPRAAGDWDKVELKVTQVLGKNGMTKIRNRFERYCAHYVKALPNMLFGTGTLFDKGRYPDLVKKKIHRPENHFVEKCRADLRLEIKHLYEEIDEASGVDQSLVRSLVHDVIPFAGFAGGRIYTLDPTLGKLFPQLQFGEVRCLKGGAVDYTIKLEFAGLIAKAYQATDPLLKLEDDSEYGRILQIAGPVGKLRRLGVLYLERRYNPAEDEQSQLVTHFQAIAGALTDILLV